MRDGGLQNTFDKKSLTYSMPLGYRAWSAFKFDTKLSNILLWFYSTSLELFNENPLEYNYSK